MKTFFKIISVIAAATAALVFTGCKSDPTPAPGPAGNGEGSPLKMAVTFNAMTRLAELPSTGEMNNSAPGGTELGLKNVGLYIYYSEDYEAGNLADPYIRNMECFIRDGQLFPVVPPGSDESDELIFIYDRMTLVAFYPYNADVPDFTVKTDEEQYPITKADYSEQYYIPYRAQTETNPTISYYTRLDFYPKHTYKVEIVLVCDDDGTFPDDGSIMILPDIDPVDNDDLTVDNKREKWWDQIVHMDNGGGGSHVRQYVAYIWTRERGDNDIERGEVLLQSNNMTLIASQNIKVQEQHVYRYGYNMSTGEIFIPTSTHLVHDRPSLEALDGTNSQSYQCCDIDLGYAGADWTPINLNGGRFDGGGHEIIGMNVTSANAGKAGLFGQVKGNTTVCNVNLIEPVINVTNDIDTLYVGAVIGKMNAVLTDAEKEALLANLPPELSQVVKEAILAELLENELNSRTNLVASKVVEPKITVNGLAPRVGSVAGQAGMMQGDGNYKSGIWDTYSLGGSISVNDGNEAANEDAYTGGFCGLNNGFIIRSYTTIDDITFATETTDGNTPPATVLEDAWTGFATQGDVFVADGDGYINGSYAVLDDPNSGVLQLPDNWPPASWVTYTGWWPTLTTGWLSDHNGKSFWYQVGSAPDNYPTLQWERR